MNKCSYTYYDNNGVGYEFDSLVELDHFLYNFGSLDYHEIQSNILYKTRQESSIDLLNKMQTDLKSKITKEVTKYDPDMGGYESYYIIEGSVGASRVINDIPINGIHLVTPFNQSEYFKNEGYSKDQESTLLSSWDIETSIGTVFHKAAECIINGERFDAGNNKSLFGANESSQKDMLNSIKMDISDLISSIKEKHGKNCKILSEVPIISKSLGEPFNNLEYDGKKISSVNGKIDLLIIDENGIAHIYDFKVSKKDVGTWGLTKNTAIKNEWSSAKKLGIEYQMEIYRTILRQNDIQVGSVNIIPIKVKYETENVNGIEKPLYVNSYSINSNKIISDGSSGNSLKRRQEKILEILPIKYITDKIDGIKAIVEPMSAMFPTYDLTTTIEQNRAGFDSIKKSVKEVREDSPERAKGKYYFHNRFKKEDNGRVYANSYEEIDEKIREYLKQIAKESANEMSYISEQIVSILEGSQSFDSFSLMTTSREENDFLRRTFKKYINNNSGNNWKFHPNETLAAAGIFVFTNANGIAEVVVLTNQVVNQVVNLGKGTSLLGATKRDFEVDEHKYLKATNGNINLMKALCLINYAYESFSKYKINRIACYNTRDQNGVYEAPSELFRILKDLSKLHNDKININLNDSNFSTVLEYVQSTVEDLCGDDLLKQYENGFFYDVDTIYDGISRLEKIGETLKLDDEVFREINSENPNMDIPKVQAYIEIRNAIGRLKNHSVYIEPDPAKHIETNGTVHTGTYWTSGEMSPSLNIQTVSNIVAQASTKIRQEISKTELRYRKVLENLYKSKGRSSLIGGEVKYFKNLFELDASGNIDSRFILKRETDSRLSKEESEFIKIFLEIVNEMKFDGNKNKIAEIRHTDEYYECPLALGSRHSQIYNGGIKEAVKTQYNEALNFLGIFNEQKEHLRNARGRNVAYNKYSIGADTRRKILSDNNLSLFETQLETLLGDYITSYHKEKV